jgi:hypothetical protein
VKNLSPVRTLGFAVLALSTALTASAHATTLVGIWTEKQVTIAADCKQTTLTIQGQVVGSQNACKIYEASGLIFAFAGLAKAEQVDVVAAIRNAHGLREMGTNRNLPVLTIIVAAQQALVQVLKARHRLSENDLDVTLIIAGTIDGKLEMIRQDIQGVGIMGDYSIPEVSRRITYPDARGYEGSDPNRGIEVVGFKNAIDRLRASSPKWNKGEDASVAAHLVNLETQDHDDSKYVGAPISEVVINEHGIKWVKTGMCPRLGRKRGPTGRASTTARH